jgi:hypothetical protein
MKIVHLESKTAVKRSGLNRAHKLNEGGRPDYDCTPESIHKIIDWLNVEKSERYQPNKLQTFCNIYAYDYACALGGFLPRVWWTASALKRLGKGEDVPCVYGTTVSEMNANALYDWFKTYSAKFGWTNITSKTEAQNLANSGKLVIMVGANINRGNSGHITAIVPETNVLKADRMRGHHEEVVMIPLQSQAGRVNRKYFAKDWQRGHETLLIYAHNV